MKLKSAKYLLVFFAIAFLSFPLVLRAQTDQKHAAPFQAGETAIFEVKFNRTLVPPMTVGDLLFSVIESPNGSSNRFRIEGNAQSRGIVKLFGRTFVQKYESTIDGEKFRVIKTVKYDEQDDRIRNSESVYDYRAGKVTYTETDPKNPARRPYQLASSIPQVTYDLVAGVYALRMLPLAVGKTFEITISESGLVYKIPVRVTARERQKCIFGKVWTYRVEPEIFGDGRPVRGKGKLILWIMDDARRLPVKAQITASIGKLEVKLKKLSNSAAPAVK